MVQHHPYDGGVRYRVLWTQVVRLYRYRALLYVLVARELKARYRGAFLGFFWSFMNPLLSMGIYTLVFSVYMRIDMPHYPAFLLCGLLPWNCFAAGLSEAASSILGNGSLIKKIALPAEIFPLVYISANLVHYLLSLPILVLLLFLYQIPFSGVLVLVPVLLGIQLLLTAGLALILASLAVQFRDLLQVIPNVLMIWFYLTPVFYARTTVPAAFRVLMDYNPMAHLIMAYQDLFFYQQCPSLRGLAATGLCAVAFLVVGLLLFEARKDYFVEEL